jgi:hypothetical protein
VKQASQCISTFISPALAICFVAITTCFATEFFVSPSGRDADSGTTTTSAFATIGKGVASVGPGDTLTIMPGTYFESVSARTSGKQDAPITIRAKRAGTVLLRGDVDAPAFRRVEGMRDTYAAEFKPRVEGVVERGTLRIYEPLSSVAEVEQTLASFHQDAQTGRLYVHTSDSAHPDWHALTLSVTNGFGLLLTPPAGSQTVHDVIVDGLSFTGYQAREFPPEPGSRNRWGLHIASGERVTVRRCTAFLNSGGIYLLAPTDAVVEDCYAFGNVSRFLDLGNNILGWSVSDTTFRHNRVERFSPGGTSAGDITFYGGARYDKKPTRGVMEDNLAINAGLMVKGAYGEDSVQRGNAVVGRGAYFYRQPDATNLLLPAHESASALQTYADPINHDYRLQSKAGDVFFVSPTGDDAATGTSLKQPWRTLAHAAQSATAGQTIYVTTGEYRETLAPARSGTAEKPIGFLRHGRDRVVLDGGRQLPVGVDLSGRSHVMVKGFIVRDFTRHGVLAQRGEDVRFEQAIVTGSEGDGVAASAVTGLTFTHNLVRNCGGAGMRLERARDTTVTGNLFDAGAGPRITCDDASLADLWSDANAFPPGSKGTPLFTVAERSYDSLAAWQKATALDPGSLAAPVGYCDADVERSDWVLRPDSPLIGRGPHASVIGPFLRLMVKRPLQIKDVAVHDLTDTTATVEWRTPTQVAETTLEWGEDAKCAQRVSSPPGSFHTVSLAGLDPGAKYFYRVTAPMPDEELVFAPHEVELPQASIAREPRVLQTPTLPARPRTFHVATTGDDRHSGLSTADAWRTISHAADEVRAGDTVLIHGGTYEETVVVRASGDEQAPITFRAAPGETVWMDGSDRFRTTAFRLAVKHHVHVDGIRFRHFRYVPHAGDVINITGGSHLAVRRCFHDGRELNGYVGNFIRASGTENLLVENCVMINGMGEGLALSKCPDVTVRHCVFYNNFIRALTAWQFDAKLLVTLSHNLFCDTIPEKTNNSLIRLSHLDSLRSDHNGYFARKGSAERHVVETANIAGRIVGHQGDGAYYGETLVLADVQKLAGQERGSIFGNPGIRAVQELLPTRAPESEWRKVEMLWNGKTFAPLDFKDFIPAPNNPFARADDGGAIGLDPQAFE